jgi:polar amino acid transport system ATP-binding protein
MIEISNVCKSYGAMKVLKGVNAAVARGEVVVLCGPSGSGKSTLLRTINALEKIDSGEILVEGTSVHRRGGDLNRLRQRIGMVFQQYNLFPHMTVLDNIAFGPEKLLRLPREEARHRALELLKRIDLEGKANVFPSSLSGGQQQRVAVVRALAMNPPVILFDEPTSALDPEMVGEVLSVMRSMAGSGITMICVTHEMGFARAVADRIWFMDRGELLVDAAPDAFYENAEHPRLVEFLSHMLHQ